MDINTHLFYKIKPRPNPIIFDIGAASGSDSYGMKRLIPQATVYSFEPDPRNIKDFRGNSIPEQFTRYGYTKEDAIAALSQVHLTPSAVGSYVGSVTFNMSGGIPPGGNRDFSYASSILKDRKHHEKHPWCTFKKSVTVPITTIDSFCEDKNITNIDFLWMDVQGAEGEVLKGADRMMNNIHYIYAECIDAEYYEGEWSFAQLKEYFEKKNWSLVERYSEDVLFRNNRLTEPDPI